VICTVHLERRLFIADNIFMCVHRHLYTRSAPCRAGVFCPNKPFSRSCEFVDDQTVSCGHYGRYTYSSPVTESPLAATLPVFMFLNSAPSFEHTTSLRLQCLPDSEAHVAAVVTLALKLLPKHLLIYSCQAAMLTGSTVMPLTGSRTSKMSATATATAAAQSAAPRSA